MNSSAGQEKKAVATDSGRGFGRRPPQAMMPRMAPAPDLLQSDTFKKTISFKRKSDESQAQGNDNGESQSEETPP
jgi:hypothetical protein